MQKVRTLFLSVLIGFFMLVFSYVPDAMAVPAFARQTGMACTACHFQHFPALNAFGATFKMNGYTMIGAEGKIEGENLSIPDTLNASLITKLRFQKTNGTTKAGTDKGEFQIPDEGALLIGGRAGEHIGFLLEVQLADNTKSAFASFKAPIVYNFGGVALSAIPFTTDEGGASYGFELLNTGATRMQRVLEDRKGTSAQQYIGTATAAKGIAFVAANSMGFLNATLWAPEVPAGGSMDTSLNLSQYLRVAATPQLGGWGIGVGGQYWGGKTEFGDSAAIPAQVVNTKAWAVDAQAQGQAGPMPLGLYAAYGNAAANDPGSLETNGFGNTSSNSKTAWSLLAELGVLPDKASVALGYRSGNNGAATNSNDNAAVLGASYLMTQNVQFQLNHTLYSGDAYSPKPAGGDQLTTFMLFAAF
jgi:hypothetical protein